MSVSFLSIALAVSIVSIVSYLVRTAVVVVVIFSSRDVSNLWGGGGPGVLERVKNVRLEKVK